MPAEVWQSAPAGEPAGAGSSTASAASGRTAASAHARRATASGPQGARGTTAAGRAGARRTTVSGWGNATHARVELLEPGDPAELRAALDLVRAEARDGDAPAAAGAIPRGMGRSYGDAAQLDGGFALATTRLTGFHFDRANGSLDARAGVTLGELLGTLVPEGWMLPVVPGTQHVSVGGAIASDLHGKNHQVAGSFCRHVAALGLLTAAGEQRDLTPDDPLFWATCGGMGLTGMITWARIRLRRIPGPLLTVDTDRVRDLEEACAALQAPGGDYRVAWLDLVSSTAGRGFVTRAEHLPGGRRLAEPAAEPAVRARASVPRGWPGGLLRASTLRAFNELRFRTAPKRARGHIETLGHHLFPLDVLGAWPRLYGRRGFLQYQFVVPFGQEVAMRRVIELLHRSHMPPYLVVLKDFGPASPGPLSFPMPGWTLALDLPRCGTELDVVLNRCDEVVADAGGRVYLSKDARLGARMLERMYPRLEEWRRLRDASDPLGLWRSDLALRTGLVAGGAARGGGAAWS